MFTGEFNGHRGVFNEAAAQCRATGQGGVTIKATTILVIGDGYTGTITTEFDSTAVRKTVQINFEGGTIRILNDKDFLALVAQP